MSAIQPSIVPPIRSSARSASRITRAVVHHGGSSPAPTNHDDCIRRVRGYDDWHRNGRGWAGLGYHRVGCAHGVWWEGRPLLMVGAHSEPANVDGIGYCYIGGNEPMTPAALHGLAAAIRQDAATLGRTLGITDHNSVEPGSTACPGPGIEAQLQELRALVAGQPTPTPAPSPSPAPRPTPAAPAFPLPGGWYFGPKSGPRHSVSGYYSHRAELRRWQQRMRDRGWRIGVDGLYGPETADIARSFQAEKGLSVDGLIGPATWAAAWTAPIT